MKRTALLIFIVVVAVGVAYGSGIDEEEPRAFRGNESLSGIDSISIDAGSFDVEVGASDGPSVSVRSDSPGDSFFDRQRGRVMSQRMGSRLRIRVRDDASLDSGNGHLRLRVPHGVTLRIRTRSGRITVEGLDNGECDLATVSGRVLLRDVRSEVVVESVSGNITLDTLQGRLRVKNVSGSIRGRDIHFTEDSELSAVSGDIEISVGNMSDELRFDLSSVSGRIVIGSIRAERGLRMGFGDTTIRGHTVSGSLVFRE